MYGCSDTAVVREEIVSARKASRTQSCFMLGFCTLSIIIAWSVCRAGDIVKLAERVVRIVHRIVGRLGWHSLLTRHGAHGGIVALIHVVIPSQ
uniref:Uncharacterized protein n=1 Tax=Oryza punctata TaxID=4537 RepID=A0A0E0MK69_ORYPU